MNKVLLMLTCNNKGKVKRIIKNSFPNKIKLKSDDLLTKIILSEDYEKLSNFFENIEDKDALLNWTINIKKGNNTINCYFSGATLNEHILILIGENKTKGINFFNELVKINNEQTNIIRKQQKEKKNSHNSNIYHDNEQAQNEQNFYDKFTKLNNDLTNIKRKLEKKNKQLSFEKNKIETIIENIPEGIITVNSDGIISIANNTARKLLGNSIKLQDGQLSDKFKIIDIKSKNSLKKELKQLYTRGNKNINSKRVSLRKSDGEELQIRFSASPLKENNITRGAIIAFNDISEKLKREKELKELSLALQNINDSVIITDQNNSIVYVNKSFLDTYNYTKKEIIGKNPKILKSESDFDRNQIFKEEKIIQNYHITKNGENIPVSVSKAPIKDKNANNNGYVMVIKDISEIKKLEEKLRKNAIFDQLTNALNKKAGITFLRKQIEEVNRHGGNFLLIFADMNNLKHINDNFGHEEGNFAIKKLSEIIQNNLRDSDIFFRYGGDEFILLVNHCPKNYCKKVWNRIKSKIRSFNKNSNKPYKLSVSKGMVEYKKSFNLTAEELIKKADKKMYAEKKAYHKKND